MRALVIGCGYLGRRVAAIWRSQGARVSALTRTAENAAVLDRLGIEPVVGDVLRPSTLRSIPAADVVLYAVGYDRGGGASKGEVSIDGVENLLREIAPRVGRFLFVSSTSVYGQNAGEWIDEASTCSPHGEDGQICVAAEQIVWRYFASQAPRGSAGPHSAEAPQPAAEGAVVMRFSGIYGPGRLLRRVESVRRGEPIRGNPEAFLNLIHVDDGARIATELATKGQLGTTYLVSDDRPVCRREYYGLLARLLGTAAPPFEVEAQDAARLNKRCSNARLHTELGHFLQFPTMIEGLPNALADDS